MYHHTGLNMVIQSLICERGHIYGMRKYDYYEFKSLLIDFVPVNLYCHETATVPLQFASNKLFKQTTTKAYN